MTIPGYIAIALGTAGSGLTLYRLWLSVALGRKEQLKSCEMAASMTIGTREIQEDSYGFVESEEGLMAVLADGQGKHYGGKIASRTAVEVFQDIFRDNNAFYNPQYYFRKAFQGANREVLKQLEENQGCASVAAVLIRERKLYYATAGNIKIAVYRNKELVPVTAGHTINVLARQKYMEGKLTRQEAVSLLEHHRLYNYVGQDGFHDVEFFDTPIALNSGEYVLLMSDGLYEGVKWKDIEDCLEETGTSQEKAFRLVEMINTSQEEDKDNSSVVIIRVR
ncbi:PP2C family protein-serine/threonine phosphatase [Lacrimispora sp.]|uniref:PP2C family protein-serine/threonine phosphatase n=1 Tax=Lacrimispora sp. TaxID=2719234 RepID=UPI0028A5A4E6|nr:serine/threonine-protein phosphatase [Lacrimispora sp.]